MQTWGPCSQSREGMAWTGEHDTEPPESGRSPGTSGVSPPPVKAWEGGPREVTAVAEVTQLRPREEGASEREAGGREPGAGSAPPRVPERPPGAVSAQDSPTSASSTARSEQGTLVPRLEPFTSTWMCPPSLDTPAK